MIVLTASSFIKAYKKLIKRRPDLKDTIQDKIDLFIEDHSNPALRFHKLKGKSRNSWSFSVEEDIRVIVSKTIDEFILVDIGKHEEVY